MSDLLRLVVVTLVMMDALLIAFALNNALFGRKG